LCHSGMINVFAIVDYDVTSLKKWALERNRYDSNAFIKACANSTEIAKILWEIINEEKFPDLKLLLNYADPIPIEWLRRILSKYPDWGKNIDCSFFEMSWKQNILSLIDLMCEEDVRNAIGRMNGVKLKEIDEAKNYRSVFSNLCVVKSRYNDIWKSWCEVRDFITTDFFYPEDGWTLAHVACRKHDEELLQDLHDRKFPMAEKDKRNFTPINYAFSDEVLTLALRFAMEDAGLGEYYVPLEGPIPDKRPPQIQTRVEDLVMQNSPLLCSVGLHLCLKNIFCDLYVPENSIPLNNRTQSDWDRVKRVASVIISNSTSEKLVCFDEFQYRSMLLQDFEAFMSSFLGEFFFGKGETRSEEDQALVEDLLCTPDEKGFPLLLQTLRFGSKNEFACVLMNLLGSEYDERREFPERLWWNYREHFMWRDDKEVRIFATSLSEVCRKIEAGGGKVPIVEGIDLEKCGKVAQNYIWKGELLAVGIRAPKRQTK
jgi:hypothetical protein